MTLEARIDALIAALNANTAALTAGKAIADAKAPQPAKPLAASPAPKAPAPTPTPAPTPPAALDYEKDVKPLALKLAAKDRPALVKILGKHGVETAAKLKPEQFKGFVADLNAALA